VCTTIKGFLYFEFQSAGRSRTRRSPARRRTTERLPHRNNLANDARFWAYRVIPRYRCRPRRGDSKRLPDFTGSRERDRGAHGKPNALATDTKRTVFNVDHYVKDRNAKNTTARPSLELSNRGNMYSITCPALRIRKKRDLPDKTG